MGTFPNEGSAQMIDRELLVTFAKDQPYKKPELAPASECGDFEQQLRQPTWVAPVLIHIRKLDSEVLSKNVR